MTDATKLHKNPNGTSREVPVTTTVGERVNIAVTAILGQNITLDDGVTIEHDAVIEDDVEIGEGSRIMQHALVRNGATLGRWVNVCKGAKVAGGVSLRDYYILSDGKTANMGTHENGYAPIVH